MEGLSNFLDSLVQWCLTSGLKLVGGVIFLLVAFKVINVIFKKIESSKPKKIKIGDIEVTPYRVDHSSYNSCMYLIEADGKKIFADFR